MCIRDSFKEAEAEVLYGLLMMQSMGRLVDSISKFDVLPEVKKIAKEKGIEDWTKVKMPGYRIFKMTERNLCYPASAMPKYTADNLRVLLDSGSDEEILEKLPEIVEKLKDRIIIGPKKEGMLLPVEWVNTLEKLVYKSPGFLEPLGRVINSSFKIWATSSPTRIVKFSTRNMLGDTEISVMIRPSVVKEIISAIKELWRVYVNHEPMLSLIHI